MCDTDFHLQCITLIVAKHTSRHCTLLHEGCGCFSWFIDKGYVQQSNDGKHNKQQRKPVK